MNMSNCKGTIKNGKKNKCINLEVKIYSSNGHVVKGTQNIVGEICTQHIV